MLSEIRWDNPDSDRLAITSAAIRPLDPRSARGSTCKEARTRVAIAPPSVDLIDLRLVAPDRRPASSRSRVPVARVRVATHGRAVLLPALELPVHRVAAQGPARVDAHVLLQIGGVCGVPCFAKYVGAPATTSFEHHRRRCIDSNTSRARSREVVAFREISDEARVLRLPSEKRSRALARGRVVDLREVGHRADVRRKSINETTFAIPSRMSRTSNALTLL